MRGRRARKIAPVPNILTGFVAVVVAAAAAIVFPAPAWAAPPATSGAIIPALIGVAVILVAALIAVLRGHARRLAVERNALASALAETRSAMASAGSAYYVWPRGGGIAAPSPNMAALIGLDADPPPDFTDIRHVFQSDDSHALNAAVGKLHDSGEHFSTLLHEAAGDTVFRATGFRLAADASGSQEADVLWLQDAAAAAAREAQLTARLARLHAFFDALPMPVWIRDENLRVNDCNAAYVRAVEANSREQVVSDGLELAGSLIADHGRGLARQVLASGQAETETHHVVIEGARRLVDLTEAPLDGVAVAGFALDMTATEDAQSELARHVAGHAEVLENMATAIAIYGPDRRLMFFNSAFLRLTQLDEAWLHSEPHFEEVLEALRERRQLPETADFPAWKQSRIKHFTSLIEPLEEQLHLPDGRTLRTVVSPHPLGGLLYTFEDVTDRLALERSYNTLIEVQRETLNNLSESIAVFGGDGRLKLSTPMLAEMWNLEAEFLDSEPHLTEVLEKTRALFRYGDDWDGFKAAIVGRFARRVMRIGKIERNDGKVLQYGFLPLPDGSVLLTSLDVTDSTRVSRALRDRNEALEAADRLKSEFIANVSYELRTPLNTIMGFIEILNNDYFGTLNERQREYSQGILESSEELLALINDILDLAMIEAGRMTLELESVAIKGMLESVVNLVRERARDKKIKLALDCPADVGALELDERRTKHALLNLIGNAIEYTESSGSIVVSARRRDDEVELAVADTGVGIAEAEQSRIFDKFVRGKKPLGHRRGAGLGLSLVRSFIDLHGGRVEIESKPDLGTTVSCFLPIRRPGGRAALTADLFPEDEAPAESH